MFSFTMLYHWEKPSVSDLVDLECSYENAKFSKGSEPLGYTEDGH